jgi:ribosomal RNA-processing protein 8
MKKRDRKSSVKSKVDEALKSSKFRYLNEQLYTTESANAVELFKESELFEDYHVGYR